MNADGNKAEVYRGKDRRVEKCWSPTLIIKLFPVFFFFFTNLPLSCKQCGAVDVK